MLRYYDPSKVEILGQRPGLDSAETHSGPYYGWIDVVVLGDGQKVMAIDIMDANDRRAVLNMELSRKYPYVRYYRIPEKYLFFFKIND